MDRIEERRENQQPEIPKIPKIPRYLLKILVASAIGALVASNIYFILLDPRIETSLNFREGSQSAVFDGRLIFNSEYSTSQNSHVFSIYSLNYRPDVELRISDLVEVGSDMDVPSTDITLPNVQIPGTITPDNPRIVRFAIDNNNIPQPGVYQGSLFVIDGTNIASLALVFEVGPPLSKPIVLVVDGIAISIAFWKIIAYLNLKYPNVELPNRRRSEALIATNGQKQFSAFAYATEKPVVVTNLILDLGTVSFGIGLALIGLPTNPAIIDVHALEWFDILTLIGMGLGIGSIKEFIPRFQPSTLGKSSS